MSVQVKVESIRVGASTFQIRGLYDLNQHPATVIASAQAGGQIIETGGDDGSASISAAQWSLFGVVWPSGQLLAEEVARTDFGSARILELGSGLALPSLVAKRQRADVTVSDHHPMVPRFLAHNLRLNDLGPVPYRHLDWRHASPSEGLYDVVLGSDVLYEPDSGAELARFLMAHLRPCATVMITDPGRRHHKTLGRALEAEGFAATETRHTIIGDVMGHASGRLLIFRRG